MRGKNWFRPVGYVAFAITALLFSVYLTFPAAAVGQRVAHEIQQRTGGTLAITFDDVRLYFFSGIAAEGVKLHYAGEDGQSVEILLDEMTLRVRLLRLLLLDLSLSAGLELGDGSIDAVLTKTSDRLDFELEIDDFDFNQPPLLARLTGLAVNGKLAGKAKGTIGLAPATRPGGASAEEEIVPDRSEAQASLTIRDAGLGPGTVYGFTVPAAVSLGQLDLAIDMRRGRARVASFQQKGGQLALDLSSGISLRRTVAQSGLDTCLRFKLTDDAFLAKYPKINTALQLAQVQLNKDGEGYLHFKLGGSLGHPQRQRGLCRGNSGGSSLPDRSERARRVPPAPRPPVAPENPAPPPLPDPGSPEPMAPDSPPMSPEPELE